MLENRKEQRVEGHIATGRYCNRGNGRDNEERKRWRDEVQGDFNIIGIKTGRQWPQTVGNGGMLYWKPKYINYSSA